MAKLKDKVTNALNETRILILGAQILLGFQFSAAFQPGIKCLPAHARALDLAAMVLMMLAVALLIAPSAFHRLAEGGHDSARVHGVTSGWGGVRGDGGGAAGVPGALVRLSHHGSNHQRQSTLRRKA